MSSPASPSPEQIKAARAAAGLDRNIASIKSKWRLLLCWVDDKHWTLTISKADTVGGMVRVEVSECCKKATPKP